MTFGLQALRAVCEAGAHPEFESLGRHLFLEEEWPAFDFIEAYSRRHGALPTAAVLAQEGIRLSAAPGELSYHLGRLRDRAAYNAMLAHQEDFIRATNARDIPEALAVLDRMREGAASVMGRTAVTPSPEAVQRIMEKHGAYTLAQLRDREVAPTVPVVHRLIGEGLTLLSADPKAGKSVLLMQAAVAVVTGQDAFGSLPVLQGPVLHLALEDNPGQFKDKMERMELEWPDGVTVFHEWSRLDQGGLEDLETTIATLRPRLVIIDTIKKIAPETRGNDRRSLQQTEYDELLPFKRLADRYRIAIVVVEHSNKGRGGDPIRRTAGSHGKTGAADNVLLYERDETQITIKVKGRNVEEGTLRLSSDRQTWRISVAGPNEAAELRQSERGVLAWLRENRGEHRPLDIARGTGMARETVSRILRRMEGLAPPRVHGDGGGPSRTYIALPEPISVFELARRQGASSWWLCRRRSSPGPPRSLPMRKMRPHSSCSTPSRTSSWTVAPETKLGLSWIRGAGQNRPRSYSPSRKALMSGARTRVKLRVKRAYSPTTASRNANTSMPNHATLRPYLLTS